MVVQATRKAVAMTKESTLAQKVAGAALSVIAVLLTAFFLGGMAMYAKVEVLVSEVAGMKERIANIERNNFGPR